MTERVFGIEQEYAFAALGPSGQRVPPQSALMRFMELARHRLTSLKDRGSGGLYLANGSRFYIDCGHPEVATPEVTDPWDLCRYIQASHRILDQLANELSDNWPDLSELLISRANVSYGRLPTTWGCHESYGYRAVIGSTELAPNLLPHLVSRLIYTGAGGFDNRSPGIDFTLSPRVFHLQQSVSDRSTSHRGIFHTKSEPLSAATYRRLHLICGEGLCSQRANWLRAATTILVLALVEAGHLPGRRVTLRNATAAMTEFACDPTLEATAELTDGRRLSAIQIQRHYLAQVRAKLGDSFFPAWAEKACEIWEETLRQLEQGPAAVSQSLDWAIKWALYREQARAAGLSWESLPRWSPILKSLVAAAYRTGERTNWANSLPNLIDANGPLYRSARALTPRLEAHGLSWDQFETMYRLRAKLFEIDTRFSQVSDRGVFTSLEKSGVLNHRVEGVENVAAAVEDPPSTSRAYLRGTTIRALSEDKHACCDWSGIWDYKKGRRLDLSDPLSRTKTWQPLKMVEQIELRTVHEGIPHLLSQTLQMYDFGRYEQGRKILDQLAERAGEFNQIQHREYHRYKAWIQSRRGFLDGPDILREVYGQRPRSLSAITDFVCTLRYQGLKPNSEIEHWLDAGHRACEQADDTIQNARTAMLGHHGYYCLRSGRAEEGRSILEQARRDPAWEMTHPHVKSRILAELAEAHRMLGDEMQAAALLVEAEQIQAANNFEGDLADFTLTYRAKLAAIDAAARDLLTRAKLIQTRLKNPMGEARTLLLLARVHSDSSERERIKRRLYYLRRKRPALAQCELLSKVMRSWRDWCRGVQSDDQPDRFWGV